MAWQKEQSGNPGGAAKDRQWRQALDRALKRRDDKTRDGDPLALERLADRVIEQAFNGDMTAVKEIAERLDGKVKQQLEHVGSEDEPPVQHKVLVEYVRPTDNQA